MGAFEGVHADYPHHDYTDVNLLNNFYHGVNENHQNAMDTASSDDFITKTVEEAYILIDNLSSSQANRRSELDRVKKNYGYDSQKIEELNADIEMLMKRDRKSVNVVGDQSDQINQELTADDSDLQADVKFIGGQGIYQQSKLWKPTKSESFEPRFSE